MSYSASTGAVTSASKSVAATGVVVGWFLVLPLVTGGLGGETFFGATAVTATGGTGLGLAILAGLPTCAFHGTLACGGVTAGGPAGVVIALAGVVAVAPPPTCTCCGLAWTFNCCLAFST